MLTGSCACQSLGPSPPLHSEPAETQRCQVPCTWAPREGARICTEVCPTFRPTIPYSTLAPGCRRKLWIKEALGFFWVVNCFGWRLTLGEKEAEVTRKIS